jgi:hypothetical protein
MKSIASLLVVLALGNHANRDDLIIDYGQIIYE